MHGVTCHSSGKHAVVDQNLLDFKSHICQKTGWQIRRSVFSLPLQTLKVKTFDKSCAGIKMKLTFIFEFDRKKELDCNELKINTKFTMETI